MAQQGFEYEENAMNALKKFGWVKPSAVTAGASHDKADLYLYHNNIEYGCELKKDLASAGSLVIHHIGSGKYEYGDTEGSVEKEFLKGLGEDNRVISAISQKWRDSPFLQDKRDEKWVLRVKSTGKHLRDRYNHDVKLGDIYFPLSSTSISKYYNLKKTYYINVATHGFYLLGNSDPADFNKLVNPKIPLWDLSHSAVLRIRFQSKGVTKAEMAEKTKGFPFTGGQGYQITMEIQFKSVKKSFYNIAPIVGKSPVIDVAKIVLPR